ncbi:MAG TPA: protein kinase [Gemmatimonadota bacterium]|nr:protein kinase [Gemmatimonadota bacterium]
MDLTPGARLGPYEILGAIGAGGMGEVHRARHEKLRREVAIKVLPTALAADRVGLARFEREARTASALNHPNIVTIYDIGEHDGTTYIAMELVEGRTLRDLIAGDQLPMDRVVGIATQTADGLAKAHAAGIVHRDIKPANVMVTDDGVVKILDFGLAKPLTTPAGMGITRSTLTTAGEGIIAGTPHYMSPEQWAGGSVDHRSDQFAFGVLLYEMACGVPPFDGPSVNAVMTAILTRDTPSMKGLRPDAPAALGRIVARCLEKDPGDRFASTADLTTALRAWQERRVRTQDGLRSLLRRPAVAVPMAAVLLVAAIGGGLWLQGSERRWAETAAVAEIASLIEAGDVYEAYRTGRRAASYLGDDPELARVMERITLPTTVNTEPQGADVWVKGYRTPDAPWERLGVTPLSVRIPYATMRWRIEKDGYETFEGAPFSGAALGALRSGLVLEPVGTRPPGMVRVPQGVLPGLLHLPAREEGPLARLETFHLDRYEVTNEQFRAFVDAGGYRNPEWWAEPMTRAGEAVAWEDAVGGFRDTTGRHGPAGWELGTYPAGEGDHPVGGISWYEAAAYCAFAGKSLPTIYHWFHAIGQQQLSDILLHSNVGGPGEGVAPVGRFAGLAAYGTYDMAGNVKEWTWNATDDLRYILGGSWSEARYVFRHLIAQDPWGRQATNGVRCARYDDPPSDELLAPVSPRLEYAPVEPVDERGFELIRGLYAYDRDSLDARVERVNDSLPDYRWETVSFNTAYGDGRMEVHLLIPHDAAPPYQSVIWFPGGDVYGLRSSQNISSSFLVDFIPRAGRVLVHPVYHGMYERRRPQPVSPIEFRDAMIHWAKDIGRTIDYLETRPDFDTDRIGYYGFSSGALFGPVFTALEPRIATAILLGAGLIPVRRRPESEPTIFGPRSRTPTLMVNGRDDFIVPYEIAQRPFFEMLGAAGDDKRHAVLTGGHIPERLEIIREVLDWLDHRFGPVEYRDPAAGSSIAAGGGGGGG